MPVFLDEDMMGRDAATIGFPHLLLCMGFVARTNNDLWGVHMVTPASSQATFAAFWHWAQGRGLATAAITEIYGCCNRKIRYGQGILAAWAGEMQWFANTLGNWHGQAHGFDTSIIDPRDGTYVEYQWRLAGLCRLFYKRDEETVQTGLSRQLVANHSPDIQKYSAIIVSGFSPILFAKPGISSQAGALDEVDYALRLTTIQL